MLVNPEETQGSRQGFAPNVDNVEKKPQLSGGQKIAWILMWVFAVLTLVGLIAMLHYKWKTKNYFVRLQMKVNESSGLIDVNLKKRRDTLVKMLEQSRAYLGHERDVFTDIAKLRNLNFNPNAVNEVQRTLDAAQNKVLVSFEQYPGLKADKIIVDLMSTSQYIEEEIASSRRLYNQYVTEFNTNLFVFPKVAVAVSLDNYHTLPLFQASEVDKQDVDMSSLRSSNPAPAAAKPADVQVAN